ncbi:hypothetical protein PWT90_07471 [Aphanocladium album]|nr:hypothetical protein PWT90_07471 [Aphanocladium album]
MTSRPRSVPPNTRVTRSSHAAAAPSDELIAVHRTRTAIPSYGDAPCAGAPSSSAAAATTTTTTNSHLVAQAEALARMTLEMNLRSVSRQANRLEADLKTLVQSTANDTAFRAQNESRLQDMWKEILAVKAHVAQDRDTKHLADEACRQEMRSAMEEMRSEISGVRETVGGLQTAVADLPSAKQIQAALSQSSDGDAARDRRERMYTCCLDYAVNYTKLLGLGSVSHRLAAAHAVEPVDTAAHPRSSQVDAPVEPRPQDDTSGRCRLLHALPPAAVEARRRHGGVFAARDSAARPGALPGPPAAAAQLGGVLPGGAVGGRQGRGGEGAAAGYDGCDGGVGKYMRLFTAGYVVDEGW